MRCLVIACCLHLLVAVPAQAADALNGDWFILSGKNKISSSNPDDKVVKDIAGLKKDVELKLMVLPAPGCYVIQAVGAYWGLWRPRFPLEKGHRPVRHSPLVKCIALMAQGGWAILYDKSDLSEDGIPAAIRGQLLAAIDDVKKAGGTLRSLAFAPDGGWALLFDKDFKEHGLPKELSRTLAEHKQKGIGVRCVPFNSRGDWFLLDDGNDCFTSTTNHPAFKKLKELRAGGEIVARPMQQVGRPL